MRNIVLVLFFLMIGTVNAQNIKYGVLFGNTSYSVVEGDHFSGNEPFNFVPGVYIDYHLNNKYGILSEVTYIKRGLHYSFNDPVFWKAHPTELKDIQLTVSLKRSVTNDYYKGGYFLIGMSLSHLISTTSFENSFPKNRAGGLVGFGYDFRRYIALESTIGYEIKNVLGNKDKKRLVFMTLGLSLKIDVNSLLN